MEVFTVNPVDQVRAAVSGAGDPGSPAAFQSTLATAVQAVSRALVWERTAEDAALSLRQRQLLAELREELEAAEKVLDQALSDQGRSLIEEPRRAKRRRKHLQRGAEDGPETRTWEGVVRATVEAVDGAADLLDDLANGQPADAPARAVAETVARLLEQHRDQLQPMAERSQER